MEVTNVEDTLLQLVAFELLEESFAINVSCVQEIIRLPAITDVPHAGEHILGVINLRGQIIPVIDLKVKFGLEKKEHTSTSRIVVVSVAHIVVGMVVDSVSEVIRIDASSIDPPSPLISSVDSDYLKGIGKQGDRMIILLDIEKILSIKKKMQGFETNLIELIEG
ncbi:MAG: chemotaxis protein CheW [Candidatus Margulisiibacteriota bacterium]|nr:MAG: chemotaxis protein CheW [Candidatus Margulisiibacteriota bacterium]HCY37018.1 chemotaxis protein CheW [Candidatus Margulisiibacteriota bacterium]